MQKNEGYLNYTLPNIQQSGVFTSHVDCVNSYYTEDVEVTYTGEAFTLPIAVTYISAIVLLVLIILSLIYITTKLPSDDARGDEGEIIQISQLKHLRKVLWAVSYTLSVAIMFIFSNFTLAYLSNNMLAKFFFMAFQVSFLVCVIALPVWFVYILYKAYKDKEFQNLINRGVGLNNL